MKKYKAYLFDLNGTMIDDMEYHVVAWHRILNNLGAGLSIERVKAECYGKNDELLERIFPGRFTEEEKVRMSVEKEREYQEAFKPHLKLIDGLDDFLRKARNAEIKIGIGTAAIIFNVDFVLDGLDIRSYFKYIVSADDVRLSKPDPETWTMLSERLGEPAHDCLVFEDSPKGAEAAQHAGMDCVVLTTMHEISEFSHLENVVASARDYDELLSSNFL